MFKSWRIESLKSAVFSFVGEILHWAENFGDTTTSGITVHTTAMQNESRVFRDLLSAQPTSPFKERFAQIVDRLSLESWLSEIELAQLCEAAFYAALCNVAFNGLGGCGGEIKPAREARRIGLEQAFMESYSEFWSSGGAKAIPQDVQDFLQQTLLKAFVRDENLAN